jgi:hypothetical protein
MRPLSARLSILSQLQPVSEILEEARALVKAFNSFPVAA